MSDFITVSLLAGYLKNIINAEEMLHNIKVVGEVSGIRCSGAHAYFVLKDEKAQIQINLFNYARTYLPKNGESVLLYGSVDFYVAGGKLSFNAKTVEPLGKGLLALKLEELKNKLLKAGYFDENHKKPIPKYPNKVCVLTAKTGAVIRDIVSTIRKKNQLLNIDVVDVKVQGNLAEESIISALDWVDTMGYDAIIIARGGGSMEDLMPFNSERLVYKIFDCNTPIISAVGHETDFTLCDFVSDKRVPTPTAAGELVGFDVKELIADVCNICKNMQMILQSRLENLSSRLDNSTQKISANLSLKVANSESKIQQLALKLISEIKLKFSEYEQKIVATLAKIESSNPAKILQRGYSKLFDMEGNPVTIDTVQKGQGLDILLDGGKINATVNEIYKNKE